MLNRTLLVVASVMTCLAATEASAQWPNNRASSWSGTANGGLVPKVTYEGDATTQCARVPGERA
jgi:hypothetical protein